MIPGITGTTVFHRNILRRKKTNITGQVGIKWPIIPFELAVDTSVPTKILVCLRVPKKSVVLACLTMAKLKMNQRVPNKNTDLLKKISLMGTEVGTQ